MAAKEGESDGLEEGEDAGVDGVAAGADGEAAGVEEGLADGVDGEGCFSGPFSPAPAPIPDW